MPRNLVFIDDNETIVGIIEMELTEFYNTTAFTDPELALTYIQANKDSIDIVLTDFMMPDMNGLQLVEKVKEINRSIKTIILTGYYNDIEEVQESACDLLLDKNVLVDKKNLIEILNQN